MKNYKTLAERLIDGAFLKGGESLFSTGEPITSGFAVGTTNLYTGKMPEHREIAGINKALKNSKSKAFGSWLDKDKTLYIDAINIVSDRNKAVEIAKGLKEIAIYDLNSSEEIRL